MTAEPTANTTPYPIRLASPSGLIVQANANGSIRRIDHEDILVNLFLGNELEGGPTNLYLRRLGESVETVPLLGPRSPGAVRCDGHGLAVDGAWQDIRFSVSLVLAESAPAWIWHLGLENLGDTETELDLIYAQDLGLAHYWAVRLNEYYVSQYLDFSPLAHPERGWVLATRQNQPMGGRNPWCLIGSLRQGLSFATDALQVHGLDGRAGRTPATLSSRLPGVRLQHEHGMAAIQDAPVRLAPGERTALGFFGWIEPDHPAATSATDLDLVDRALALPEARLTQPETANAAPPAPLPPRGGGAGGEGERLSDHRSRPSPQPSLFASAPLLECEALSETEIVARFGPDLREVERAEGQTLSFFHGARSHVALRAKELEILRPHGQVLRTGAGLTPDEAALTSTCWMAGVFHSMVTQGHVSINRLLSTVHGYLGLFRSHGQRLFVELGGGWRLLDVPSAFETDPQCCRWYYRHAAGLIRIESRAATDRHELSLHIDVLEGGPLRFLLSNHIAINGDDGAEPIPLRVDRDSRGFFIRAIADCDIGRRFPDGGFRLDPLPGTEVERFGNDELLFLDGRSLGQPVLCIVARPATRLEFRLTGGLIGAPEAELGSEDSYWAAVTAGLRLRPPAGSPLAGEAARLGEVLPWLAQNALIHYLSPRGLEQYSGGGWGTRDVTQGPVEMLLALGRPEPVRDLLVRVLKQQNPDGDWPQWFMFFDRERNIRPGDSHGDIVFWPLLALAQYLMASGDLAFLDEPVPFFRPEGEEGAERAPVREHLERALGVIANRTIPGTRLAAYGNGDWNDSLQPLDPAMRERLCSAWTVTLHFRTLRALAAASAYLGLGQQAARFAAMAEQVRADFQRYLVVDGVLTGFAQFEDGRPVAYLLHPRDPDTGISYSLLAMVHALADGLFTPEQARGHLDLIGQHLLGPDGARLFDRPMPYRGGMQRRFQRAETSSFFGREIGLMYTHAHLRYAEALWRYGDAEGFFRALCLANPIGIRDRLPAARRRQANCYYSSSDANFADRYQAERDYDRLMRGDIPLDGGWRVYSSGAGIGMGLILRCLLGLRIERGRLVVDPAIPASLDGLVAELDLLGHSLRVLYRIRGSGCGPSRVTLNGRALPFERAESPYRLGAAEVRLDDLVGHLAPGPNRLDIDLGQ